jgi:hypothetical protein
MEREAIAEGGATNKDSLGETVTRTMAERRPVSGLLWK